jgi:hypothetical protein
MTSVDVAPFVVVIDVGLDVGCAAVTPTAVSADENPYDSSPAKVAVIGYLPGIVGVVQR